MAGASTSPSDFVPYFASASVVASTTAGIVAASGPLAGIDVRPANAARVHAVTIGAAHSVGAHAGGNRVGIPLQWIFRRRICRNLEVDVLSEQIRGRYDDNDQYEIDRPHSGADYSALRGYIGADLEVGPYIT